MKDEDFLNAITRAEASLVEMGNLKPTPDTPNFSDYSEYQPVTVSPFLTLKKIDMVSPEGEREVFGIAVFNMGGQAFTEIYKRISTNLK